MIRAQNSESVSHNDLVELILARRDRTSLKRRLYRNSHRPDPNPFPHARRALPYMRRSLAPMAYEMARALWSLAREGQYEESATTDTAFRRSADIASVRIRCVIPAVIQSSCAYATPKFIPPLSGPRLQRTATTPDRRTPVECGWLGGHLGRDQLRQVDDAHVTHGRVCPRLR